MTCNLFSSFDPSTVVFTNFFQAKWVMISLVFLLFHSYFLVPLWSMLYLTKIFDVLINVTKSIFDMMYKHSCLIMVTMFSVLFIINELGMLPFMFVPTGHLSFNMSLAIPFWLGGILYTWSISPAHFLSHLLPIGSPIALAPLLVLVESVSLLIRPFSLSVRLMSNVLAGHMILALTMSSMFPLVIPLSSLFIMFEIAVGMVQSFVFSNLVMMYLREAH